MADNGQIRHRHEPLDINSRAIVWVGFSLVITLILSGLIVFGLFTYFGGRLSVGSTWPQKNVSENRIVSPSVALRKEKLHSYGWIDKEKRIIHIPIEFAMELLAKRKEVSRAGELAAQPRKENGQRLKK